MAGNRCQSSFRIQVEGCPKAGPTDVVGTHQLSSPLIPANPFPIPAPSHPFFPLNFTLRIPSAVPELGFLVLLLILATYALRVSLMPRGTLGDWLGASPSKRESKCKMLAYLGDVGPTRHCGRARKSPRGGGFSHWWDPRGFALCPSAVLLRTPVGEGNS